MSSIYENLFCGSVFVTVTPLRKEHFENYMILYFESFEDHLQKIPFLYGPAIQDGYYHRTKN